MNKEEISQLIYFLYKSIKENDNVNMNKAEEVLKNLCSPDQDTYLLVGEVLASIIFDSKTENNLRMLSVIILSRCNILRTDVIISQFIDCLCKDESLNEASSLLKQLCSTIAEVIEPSHVEQILNYQPNYSTLFILYFYLQEKEKKEEEIKSSTELFEYIVKYSLFDPSKTNIEISTIAIGILSFVKMNDDSSYDELVLSFFSQLPVESEYFPILFELIGSFNNTKNCAEKLPICYEKLSEISKIEQYPFEVKNVLDHYISIEFITDHLIKYIYYYLDENEEEEEENFEIDKSDLFQLCIRFCTIQDYVKERWLNDIDSFLIEIQEDLENDDFIDLESGFCIHIDQNPIRCHTLQIIQEKFTLTEFQNGMIELIQQNESNSSLVVKLEEVYYYVLFYFLISIQNRDISILPPVDEDDVLLNGEYIRCMITIGKTLSEEEYLQILQPETHYILKIMLAQGIVENKKDEFPNKLILNCIECLIQMIDLFQTDADIDLFEIIEKLVLKSQMEMDDYLQIILLLKNRLMKYMNNINIIKSISKIISNFLNSKETVPIISDNLIPLILESFGVDDLKTQSLLLFKSMTEKLPYINEEGKFLIQTQISESTLNLITNNILNEFIIPICSFLLNDSSNDDNDLLFEFIFSIDAFYCRIEIIHPSFLHLIILSIEKMKNKFINDLSNFGKPFISFAFEYLLVQSDENIGKIKIIQKIIEFISLSNNDDHKISKDNLLILSLALFCTQNHEIAIPLFNSVNNFYETVFSFILNNFEDFRSEERCLYTIMYLICVKAIPQLENENMDIKINKIFEISDFENDQSCFLDENDPFIANHLIKSSAKILSNYLHELINQLSQ